MVPYISNRLLSSRTEQSAGRPVTTTSVAASWLAGGGASGGLTSAAEGPRGRRRLGREEEGKVGLFLFVIAVGWKGILLLINIEGVLMFNLISFYYESMNRLWTKAIYSPVLHLPVDDVINIRLLYNKLVKSFFFSANHIEFYPWLKQKYLLSSRVKNTSNLGSQTWIGKPHVLKLLGPQGQSHLFKNN